MNRIIIKVAVLLCSLIFLCCNVRDKDINLIIIDELNLDGGVKINFFVGYDSVKTFQLIKNKGFELDVVDSKYVFIINESDFDSLYSDLFKIDVEKKENLNIDSFYRSHPRIINVSAFGNDKTYSQHFINDAFQKRLAAKWLTSAKLQGKDTERLFYKLKQHLFLKEE